MENHIPASALFCNRADLPVLSHLSVRLWIYSSLKALMALIGLKIVTSAMGKSTRIPSFLEVCSNNQMARSSLLLNLLFDGARVHLHAKGNLPQNPDQLSLLEKQFIFLSRSLHRTRVNGERIEVKTPRTRATLPKSRSRPLPLRPLTFGDRLLNWPRRP